MPVVKGYAPTRNPCLYATIYAKDDSQVKVKTNQFAKKCESVRRQKGIAMAQGFLTTHVLDTSQGRPAAGLSITLYRLVGETREVLAEQITNADGRTDQPMLPQDSFAKGTYELVFRAGAYLDAQGTKPEDPRFLDIIPIRFGVSDDNAHYHVPLLLSPFGYSTYRGS